MSEDGDPAVMFVTGRRYPPFYMSAQPANRS